MDINAYTYVSKADSLEVCVTPGSESSINVLRDMGFSYNLSTSEHTKEVIDENDKARLLQSLKDIDIAFSAGAGWSPSEVFEQLRFQGKVSGSYRRISWSSPNQVNIVEA